jgi:L-lactate utilization protein LutC
MPPSSRDDFLRRVRRAVSEGNRVAPAPDLPARGSAGYQGAGPDPVARFRDELVAAGGQLHVVADGEAAAARVLELVQAKGAHRALVGRGPVIDRLGLPDRLRALGVEVSVVDALPPEGSREVFFAADVGISGVDYLVAETGTIALLARPGEPRSLSLLPPVHVAVADRSQIVPDLFDLFAGLPSEPGQPPRLPSCLSLITGPSKTGDIELRLVTGVHGPGEVHVVLVDGPDPSGTQAAAR